MQAPTIASGLGRPGGVRFGRVSYLASHRHNLATTAWPKPHCADTQLASASFRAPVAALLGLVASRSTRRLCACCARLSAELHLLQCATT